LSGVGTQRTEPTRRRRDDRRWGGERHEGEDWESDYPSCADALAPGARALRDLESDPMTREAAKRITARILAPHHRW